MAIEDEMKKIEETKDGRGDTNIFGTRRLGAVIEEKIPDWMGSVKGIVEKGKQNVETFETLQQGRSVEGGYFREDNGSDIRILNDNVKDFYQEGVYENLEPKEIMLNAFYLQDMVRNGIKQGGEYSDELSNYNSHNAIAAIQKNLLANGKTEEEIEQAYKEAVALYKQRDFTAITPNNREELEKKISPLGIGMFQDLVVNNKREADRVVENTKDLFKFPFRAVALNLTLPKEAVLDLPAMFMDPNDVAGYQKRLENPFGQEQFEEYQRSGKSSPLIRSGMYYFGKLFQDIADDEVIGLKSTSIKFKKNIKLFVCISYFVTSTSLMYLFFKELGKNMFSLLLLIFIISLIYQVIKFNKDKPKTCLNSFKLNNYSGLFLFFSSGVVEGAKRNKATRLHIRRGRHMAS